MAVSITAMLAFNFFFLPPFYTLTIADPQNWVALFVFLVVAIIASQLSGRARQRELEALNRQRDLERLYAFSRSVLLSESDAMPTAIARSIADAFELPCVALYDHQSGIVSWGGAVDPPPLEDKLREVARRGTSFQDGGTLITAVQAGRSAHRQPRHRGRHAQRHGAPVGGEPGRDWSGAGSRADGNRARRSGAPEQRVEGRRPGRRRP